jgi:hypothetical protein
MGGEVALWVYARQAFGRFSSSSPNFVPIIMIPLVLSESIYAGQFCLKGLLITPY